MLKFSDGEEGRILGFRVYYGDGEVVTGSSEEDWKLVSVNDVQVVLVFYDRAYQCHTGEKFETLNYIENLNQADYYWRSPTKGFGVGPAPEDGVVKHGQWCEKFREIYNRTLQDRTWR